MNDLLKLLHGDHQAPKSTPQHDLPSHLIKRKQFLQRVFNRHFEIWVWPVRTRRSTLFSGSQYNPSKVAVEKS